MASAATFAARWAFWAAVTTFFFVAPAAAAAGTAAAAAAATAEGTAADIFALFRVLRFYFKDAG